MREWMLLLCIPIIVVIGYIVMRDVDKALGEGRQKKAFRTLDMTEELRFITTNPMIYGSIMETVHKMKDVPVHFFTGTEQMVISAVAEGRADYGILFNGAVAEEIPTDRKWLLPFQKEKIYLGESMTPVDSFVTSEMVVLFWNPERVSGYADIFFRMLQDEK